MQHTHKTPHYIYKQGCFWCRDERARVCDAVCMPRGMPTTAAKALCRRLRIQLLPRALDDGIRAHHPCVMYGFWLHSLQTQLITNIAWRSRASERPTLIYFLLKHSRRRPVCYLHRHVYKAPASDSILLIELGCVCSSRMPPSGNGGGRVGVPIGAHIHAMGPRRGCTFDSAKRLQSLIQFWCGVLLLPRFHRLGHMYVRRVNFIY